MAEDLVIDGKKIGSRLILGTGGISSLEVLDAVLEASGTDLATVAVRRVDAGSRGGILDVHQDALAQHDVEARPPAQDVGQASEATVDDLETAIANADTMLVQCAYLHRPESEGEIRQLGAAAQSLRTTYENGQRRAGEEVAHLTKLSAQVEGTLTSLEAKINGLQTSTSSIVSDFQFQFSTAQESRSQAFADSQTAHQRLGPM